MRARDAERAAKRFVAKCYPDVAHWNFDIAEEQCGRTKRGSKVWSFSIRPDEEDADYERGVYMVGYVHADGKLEGLY